jgi:hypothetical protein
MAVSEAEAAKRLAMVMGDPQMADDNPQWMKKLAAH